MKKKLEGELISIAHRVLKLKNRSETVLLQREAKKLYEQLTVLRFYEENFETLKNDISKEQLEEKLEQMTIIAAVETTDLEEKVAEVVQSDVNEEPIIEEIEQPIEVQAEEIVPEEPVKEEIVAEEVVSEKVIEEAVVSENVTPVKEDVYATAEDINRIVSEMSNKKNVSDSIPAAIETFEVKKPNASQQIAFEDLLGESYKDPEFVRVEDTPKEVEQAADLVFERKEEILEEKNEVVEKAADVILERANELPIPEKKEEFSFTTQSTDKQEVKSKSLNDRLTSGISFGLNDRIAFEKKLFGGSADDFNRVISQLNTFDSFDEASSFIIDFVKPDYKNWEGQEEYETRFLEIVEKKFN
ncbi:hypothetical protein FLGE108171_11825 [Flavobacterium gelidilacus]|uniref:hypothetical protein n=1 Tax=Flavobacterium gelidilacus TaxID=206041 RepID=UPI0004076E0F|nr:hypothetical protein [Flavobacterium gelidilacus]